LWTAKRSRPKILYVVTAYRESNGEIAHPAVLKGTLNFLNAASGTHSTNFKRSETMEAVIQKQIAAIRHHPIKKITLVSVGKGQRPGIPVGQCDGIERRRGRRP
jgi:hypothetical protein